MSAGTAAIDADCIDALLPQTQCTRCGFAGCRPYADAIHLGAADINQCPPGGQATIDRLAALLGRPSKSLNPDNGSESAPTVAWIDAQRCIGCAKCLPPCPVDAIVGAPKFLHAVIVEHCTGCELCLAPCPVDCIVMRPAPAGSPPIDAAANRRRYQRHQHRLEHRQSTRARELEAVKSALNATTPRPTYRTPEKEA